MASFMEFSVNCLEELFVPKYMSEDWPRSELVAVWTAK